MIDDLSLRTIKESTILSEDDLKIVSDLQNELQENFLKAQIFRTATEMEISVLQDIKHPTPDSKYWQAVKEQNVMYTELVSLSYEYRETRLKVKQIERQIYAETDELEQELLQVQKERLEFRLKQQERVAQDRIREIQLWHEIKEGLKPHLKYGTDDVNAHQLESYTRRFINQSNILGENSSMSERSNLLGQLYTSISKMKRKGIWEELEKTLPSNTQE